MLPYLIAGVIGYGISKLFDDKKAPKYVDGGEVDIFKSLFIKNGFTQDDLQRILEENENYFNQIEFYDNETIIVYRTIALPRRLVDKFIVLDKKEIGEGIGEYWTLDKEFGRAVWSGGHYEGEETFDITCVGHLKIKDIDWEMMKYAFNDDGWHFGSESEIRGVNGGNSIKVVECQELIYENGGLIAPNGKPSGLYFTEIYNLVRTKEFKEWFGDWEEAYRTKNYDGVSKIIDENGEPLICVHNTPNEFYEFDEYEIGRNTDAGYYGKGFYFTPNVGQSRYGEIELNCFLNIKNPYFKQSSYRNYELNSDELKNQSYDGVVVFPTWIDDFNFENGVDGCEEVVAYYSEQIKLGDGRNTNFDKYNPDIRFDKGGLVAPNGKPSNLTPEQYKLVRTPAFKKWFGDWENDPANSSKIVDSNGEPLVVFHGGKTKFNIFSPYSQGHYFTDNIKYAKAFTEKSDDGHLFKCFINVRNYLDARKLSELTPSFEINEKELIMFFKKNGIYSKEMEKSIKDFFKKQYLKKTFWSYLNNYGIDIPSSYKEIYDAIFLNEHSLNGTKINVYFVHESNQIKLADGTNTTFDSNNPDIRFDGGGEIKVKKIKGELRYYNKGAYANINIVDKDKWHLSMIENQSGEKGMASKILLQIIKDARANNVKKISLSASYENKQIFHHNYGFKTISYGEYSGLYNMELDLSWKYAGKRFKADWDDDVYIHEEFDLGGTTMRKTKLLAPNGKPSNLTPEQYKLVRTKAFKDWFGDWQNDPANASKIVDENGEPLPVYHGSRSKFDIFDIQKSGESNTTSKVGFWFTSIKMFAENFANSIWYGKSENEVIYSVFLSVKNPKIYESEIISEKQKDKLRLKISDLQNESRSIQKKWVTGDWDYKDRMVLDASIRGSINEENFNDYLNLSNKSKDAINDGILISDINEKIKNIENKLYGLTYNDSYEKFRTDIYKVEGKSSEQANMGGLGMALSDPNGTIKKYVNSLKNKGNDGIIIKKTRFDKSNAGGLNDQYVAFESNQIKLADGTNTTFDGNNPDIRFDGGGELDESLDIKNVLKYLSPTKKEKELSIREQWDDLISRFSSFIPYYFEQENIEYNCEDYECVDFLYESNLDSKFEKWIINNFDKFNFEDFDIPSWYYFENPKIVKGTFIHYSDNVEEILKYGFTKGVDDISILGMTTRLGDEYKKNGGLIFAYDINDLNKVKSNRYGNNCVMFEGIGIRSYHKIDEEYEVIINPNDISNIRICN